MRRRRRTGRRMRPSTHIASEGAATTCSSQWRRDARVLGSLPIRELGLWAPLPFVRYPRWQESTCWSRVAVRKLSLWVASLGDMSQPPLTPGRFLGRRPLSSFRHCTGQVATDPRSPKGGSQRGCPLGVPTPRLLGVAKECKAVGPALAVKVREF